MAIRSLSDVTQTTHSPSQSPAFFEMEDMSRSEQLEVRAKKLSVEEAIVPPSDDIIINDVEISKPSADQQTVLIGQVHTYIYTHELSKELGNQRIVFPTFASHWAVLVTDKGSKSKFPRVYHLTFKDPGAAELTPPPGASREIQFTGALLDDVPDSAKAVGCTEYTHSQLMTIGQSMVKAFGSYHRVFWNCQHFARLYLHIITKGQAKFEEWTLGQTANLFLCAFLISAPVATTNKALATQKARQILSEFAHAASINYEDAVLRASDEAITLAQNLAIQDYQRNCPSEVQVKQGGTLQNILDTLIRIGERIKGTWSQGQDER